MNNADMEKIMAMLSKIDKKDLEAGIQKANAILNSKDKDSIINEFKKKFEVRRLCRMNNEDLSEIREKFKSTLNNSSDNKGENSGSPNISPETISAMMQMLNSGGNQSNENKGSSNEGNNSSAPNIDIDTILKFKTAFDKMNSKDDPRSKLLLALKPYLKESRKEKLDQYIQLFNIGKVIDIFGFTSGGDAKK